MCQNVSSLKVHTPPLPPPLRHAPAASLKPTAPLANSSVGYFQLGFSFGGNRDHGGNSYFFFTFYSSWDVLCKLRCGYLTYSKLTIKLIHRLIVIASFQLSHVILESTRLSDGPGDATTSLDASVDDSRDEDGTSYLTPLAFRTQ